MATGPAHFGLLATVDPTADDTSVLLGGYNINP